MMRPVSARWGTVRDCSSLSGDILEVDAADCKAGRLPAAGGLDLPGETGRWIMALQGWMADAFCKERAWRELLLKVAGIRCDAVSEDKRGLLIFDWIMVTVLGSLQPCADAHGFGAAWSRMISDRSGTAASEAMLAASAAADSSRNARNGVVAAHASSAAAAATCSVIDYSGVIADSAARALMACGEVATVDDAWKRFDPLGLLRLLVITGAERRI
ncbi:hypothetical protein [Arthrobacter bambusae]|uniref:Uncharacterized protein n=1 Tax=Arthrobacter bambusae TaxID=1338426 RepID=A0AAW8DC86_9MICC|nr:hypothetical protein [Arthrobacter bambusae]MDP9903227.1 hypothetical protein [Arthrobacter bambusae]MDQ0128779.1 hypothetical protein [Arthrobacter bambusae]MDQ0180120.1 hypothetical protein [Arthrobacter bambusae]